VGLELDGVGTRVGDSVDELVRQPQAAVVRLADLTDQDRPGATQP
jgi:hypothetical protein